MGIFEQPLEWARNFLPSDKAKKDEVHEGVNEKVRDLRGDEYLKTVELWKSQIEKGIAGEYGEEYKFTDKELGIQNMRSGKSLFVTIDNNSPLLNNEFFLEALSDGFEKKEGSLNVVFCKILKKTENVM